MSDDLDHVLIYRVRKLINGANVHELKNWIFGYEQSLAGSRTRVLSEEALRGFLAGSVKALRVEERIRASGTRIPRRRKAA